VLPQFSLGDCGLQRSIGKSNHPNALLQQGRYGGTKTDRRPTVLRGVSSA